jgi:hypothetical protein
MSRVIVMKAKAGMTFGYWWDAELTKRMYSMSQREAVFDLLDYIADSDIMNKIEWAEEEEYDLVT